MEESRPVGRPTTYNPDIAARICGEIASGKSLRTVCKADDMPALSTIFVWRREHPEFAEQYARAEDDRAAAFIEDITAIADDSSEDWEERVNEKGETYTVLNRDNINRSRLRVDSRKWLASKILPKRYGDKVELSGSETSPLKVSIQIDLGDSGK